MEVLMPWKEVKLMDQRVCFIADYLRGGSADMSALLKRYINQMLTLKFTHALIP